MMDAVLLDFYYTNSSTEDTLDVADYVFRAASSKSSGILVNIVSEVVLFILCIFYNISKL